MSSKALEMGVCFHSGPEFGKYRGAHFLRFLNEKNLIEIFVLTSKDM
jgi:hypothetical protein